MPKLTDSRHSEVTHTIELTDKEVNALWLVLEESNRQGTATFLRVFFTALKDGSATIRLR
jgi:hypothetical protein